MISEIINRTQRIYVPTSIHTDTQTPTGCEWYKKIEGGSNDLHLYTAIPTTPMHPFIIRPYGSISAELLERYSLEQIHRLCIDPMRLPAGLKPEDKAFVYDMIRRERRQAEDAHAEARNLEAIKSMMIEFLQGRYVASFNHFGPLYLDQASIQRRYLVDLATMGILTFDGQQQIQSEQREYISGTFLLTPKRDHAFALIQRLFDGYGFCCVIKYESGMSILHSNDVLHTAMSSDNLNIVYTDQVLTLDGEDPFTFANIDIDPMNLIRFVDAEKSSAVVTFVAWEQDWNASSSRLVMDIVDSFSDETVTDYITKG